MTTSRWTSSTARAQPPPRAQSKGYAGETELSKLIRYGGQFELEVNQMEEQRHMQAENMELRRKGSSNPDL
ncbi:MAG: hypothetical protein QOK27_1344 [Gemmatimonadales bacterium]|nr:hypothetical protein [Gemmatimonadales bacterium]